MERLGDDLLHYIFNKLPNDKNFYYRLSKDRESFFQVSKQFMKPACLGLFSFTSSVPGLLFDILPSSPNMIMLDCHEPLSNAHLKLLARSCPKLEELYLNVNDQQGFDVDFDDEGLCALGDSCTQLKYVSLRRRLHVGDAGVVSLVASCKNLKNLDLEGCVRVTFEGAGIVSLVSSSKKLKFLNLRGCIRVTDESLKAIGESGINYLNLEGCCFITDIGLEFLASGNLKNSLEELKLTRCDMISDNGVIHLKQMVNLTNLYLSKCDVHVTDTGIVALISQLPNITTLDLSWLINVTDISLLAIASKCLKLSCIYLDGCETITAEGLRAFSGHQTLTTLSLFSCYNFTWEDVKSVAITCKNLSFVGLQKTIKTPMPKYSPEYVSTQNNSSMFKIYWH